MGTLISNYGYQLLSAGVEATDKLDKDRIFEIDSQLLFDACVLALNIFLLFIILSYVLFNPVRKMLTQRQEKITAQREDAIADKEEAAKLKENYEIKLKDINKEAEVILSEARKKARANEDRIVSEAKEEAARIIAQAKAECELEKRKAADDVKKEIILVSTLMANKLVAATIDKQTQDTLIEETLGEIGDRTWLN